jgi:Protein of unknown function (DUF1659)
MAIVMTKDSRLRVIFETGLSDEGKPIYKAKSYSNVADGVTPEQLQQVGLALASLSTYPMDGIQHSELREIL